MMEDLRNAQEMKIKDWKDKEKYKLKKPKEKKTQL